MSDEVHSLTEIAERLFSKPPVLQGIGGPGVAQYVNASVNDIEEGLVRQLLNSELCTAETDLKEFNEYVATGSLLHLLAFVGRHEAAEWLLRNGAYVHTRTHGGSTPLHVASFRRHTDTIKVLRFHHADVYTENKEKKNALDLGQGADDVKESLLTTRFASEVLEEEYLRDRLPPLVEKIKSKETDPEDFLQSLLCLRAEIRSSTSSMTSVPKPLKLLTQHYIQLKEVYHNMSTSREEARAVLADVLSVLGVTVEDKDRDCLHFRLAGSKERISSFGHPYIRRVCTQIPEEWTVLTSPEDTLHDLVVDIASYCLQHSAETEACDLLMEIEQIDLITSLVTTETYGRVCLYLSSCVKYVPEPEDSILLHTTIKTYLKFKQFPQALRLAMMLNDRDLIKKIFHECHNSVVRKQLSFMLGRQQMFLELDEECSDADDLTEIMSNVHLNTNFLNLARELDIMEPKVPEDIYKTHLEHARFSSANTVDSARANLASSLVNGFVNAGFGQDKLLTNDGNKWLYKNKGYGMMSATASLGLVLLWDVEGGLTQIDKFLYSTEDNIKSGALLACGVVNCGVRNECDPALALLSDYVLHQSNTMRIGAIIGLGLAYAGSAREDVIQLLIPVLWESSSSLEVVCLTALSCGMVAVGSCHDELTQALLLLITKKDSAELVKTHCRYLALALGLLHLGKPSGISIFLEVLKTVPEPFRSFASTMLEICAYVGSGAVLKVQELLHICSDRYGDKTPEQSTNEKSGDKTTDKGKEEEGKKDQKPDKDKSGGEDKGEEKADPDLMGSIAEPGSHQSLAVLGIALIAMGEDIGAEMSLRTFNHLLHYGEPVIRRAVPLALALLSTSHPQLPILDTLSKFSHDSDSSVARNAIFSMGLVGSGTNNARLAGMLRNLAQFYHKDPLDLFVVRLAQGLTHLGKGTLTLNPYHSDRMLMSPVVVAGLLSVAVSMLDHTNTILGDPSYMLFYLTPAIQPRMLVTFNADLEPLAVTVRVGQAVDVVGQAGKPKTITGFQTHTTPVLLAYGERAELATEEYVPLTPILEGFVILEKNPNYVEG